MISSIFHKSVFAAKKDARKASQLPFFGKKNISMASPKKETPLDQKKRLRDTLVGGFNPVEKY